MFTDAVSFNIPPAGSQRLGSRRPCSRRLGGPIPFAAVWPIVREDLHEAYLARLEAARGAASAHEERAHVALLRPIVSEVLPLTDARRAQEESEARHVCRKIVLRVQTE
jgi:hypothetical protein